MDWTNWNTLWASAAIAGLREAGVHRLCLSPGSRSAPLAIAAAQQLTIRVHPDERCSAFWALGAAKRSGQPVGLLCTSGTAAAHFFPAIVEAFASGVPLVVLTADRPPALRDCGAGQAIDQLKLYGSFVRYFAEVGEPQRSPRAVRALRALMVRAVAVALGRTGGPPGPIHLNFPLPEPLAPVPGDPLPPEAIAAAQAPLAQSLPSQRWSLALPVLPPRGLVMVGPYPQAPSGFAQAVRALRDRLGYPLLAEATGLARTGGAIGTYDTFLRSPLFRDRHVPELVIRFGAPPTSKVWNQWLEEKACPQVVVGSPVNNEPTHGPVTFWEGDPCLFCEALAPTAPIAPAPWREAFQRAHAQTLQAMATFLNPLAEGFEGKVYAELARHLPPTVDLWVASSNPIRDLDSFFQESPIAPVWCHRGVNGIDGMISSALGSAWVSDRPTVLVCGDLAFCHDLNGLWAAQRYGGDLTVVLIDNNGGGIFEGLPIRQTPVPFEELFAVPLNCDWAPAVRMYGGTWQEITTWDKFRVALPRAIAQGGLQVLHLKTDRQRSMALRQAFWARIAADNSLFPDYVPPDAERACLD
ncbi:MAG: 2-succinyl-5-enolpyruvyl-6-hydroxy-3-cyclohexene-1-carboxylic-acid synthase [Pseudanabaenaceae cyanobacterium]